MRALFVLGKLSRTPNPSMKSARINKSSIFNYLHCSLRLVGRISKDAVQPKKVASFSITLDDEIAVLLNHPNIGKLINHMKDVFAALTLETNFWSGLHLVPCNYSLVDPDYTSIVPDPI